MSIALEMSSELPREEASEDGLDVEGGDEPSVVSRALLGKADEVSGLDIGVHVLKWSFQWYER